MSTEEIKVFQVDDWAYVAAKSAEEAAAHVEAKYSRPEDPDERELDEITPTGNLKAFLEKHVASGEGLARQAARAAARCSDRVEHLAQYDDRGLDEAVRLSYVAQDMHWLMETLPSMDDIFKVGSPFGYSLSEIKDLGKLAWERSGKRMLPTGFIPTW